jgi:hypothetical protein
MKGCRVPEFPPIPEDGKTRSGPPEFFTHNMDYPEKRLILGMDKPRLANWHRLKAREGLDPVANLICMGDALPPSTMGLMKKEGMISSINWQINLLTDAPAYRKWLVVPRKRNPPCGAWREQPIYDGVEQ